MATDKKKTKKHRGKVSHGHARIGKHRKQALRRVNADAAKPLRVNMDKYNPGYIGKIGMRNFHLRKSKGWKPAINVDKLWDLINPKTKEPYRNDKKGRPPVIDVSRAGYFKVLAGKGSLPKQPIIVKAKFFSRLAEERIKEIGGCCVLVAD